MVLRRRPLHRVNHGRDHEPRLHLICIHVGHQRTGSEQFASFHKRGRHNNGLLRARRGQLRTRPRDKEGKETLGEDTLRVFLVFLIISASHTDGSLAGRLSHCRCSHDRGTLCLVLGHAGTPRHGHSVLNNDGKSRGKQSIETLLV